MTRRIMGWCLAVVMAAGISSLAMAAETDAKKPSAVLDYNPLSRAEARDFRELDQADARARALFEKNREAFDLAVQNLTSASMALEAEELPPEVKRPTREQVDELYALAIAARVDAADVIARQIDEYKQFLRRYPDNWYARHRYAWFLSDHLLRYEAAEEWEKVIAMEPRFPYAYNNLGSLYNHMGRDKESIQLYRKAIELKNDDPVFHLNLAVNYSTHRKEAMELYGWDLPRTFRECINSYRRARTLAPQDREIAYDLATQFVLAKYFEVTNTADEALDAWTYYLALDLPQDQRGYALRNVARIYLTEKNDPATAKALLEKALILVDDPSNRTLLQRAEQALQGGGEAKIEN